MIVYCNLIKKNNTTIWSSWNKVVLWKNVTWWNKVVLWKQRHMIFYCSFLRVDEWFYDFFMLFSRVNERFYNLFMPFLRVDEGFYDLFSWIVDFVIRFLSMYMVSFIFVIVCGVFWVVSESVQDSYSLFIS